MASIRYSDDKASTSGTFTSSSASPSITAKPLLVLIHGGGVNSRYFDNSLHSIPREFNNDGYNVLNMARVGYEGNPILKTETPLFDSSSTYAGFIGKVYQENHGGKGGIVIIGHSLGAATSIIIAALEGDNIPLIGVSALGIIPSPSPPELILEALNADPEAERIELGKPDELYFGQFMGAPDFFDISKFDEIRSMYEGIPRNELAEWSSHSTYHKFVDEVAPRVKIPLQFLAAEIEFQWSGLEQARPIFDQAKRLFNKVPRLDAHILPGGAHNYEFSVHSSRLHKRRLEFIESLVWGNI